MIKISNHLLVRTVERSFHFHKQFKNENDGFLNKLKTPYVLSIETGKKSHDKAKEKNEKALNFNIDETYEEFSRCF